jgi:hypothetical protein
MEQNWARDNWHDGCYFNGALLACLLLSVYFFRGRTKAHWPDTLQLFTAAVTHICPTIGTKGIKTTNLRAHHQRLNDRDIHVARQFISSGSESEKLSRLVFFQAFLDKHPANRKTCGNGTLTEADLHAAIDYEEKLNHQRLAKHNATPTIVTVKTPRMVSHTPISSSSYDRHLLTPACNLPILLHLLVLLLLLRSRPTSVRR